MEKSLDQNFWNERWEKQQTGWDIGYASTPIVDFMSGYINKEARILIPGCGNAYEAAFLSENNFRNITLIDISQVAIEKVKKKFQNDPNIQIILGDFFEHSGVYDLIIEQTFFCALDPKLRPQYVNKTHSLLTEEGSLVGVLFGKKFTTEGPPFGGTKEEYISLFGLLYNIKKMELCYNSIRPRQGSELFIELKKS